jgi:hypothetical protein
MHLFCRKLFFLHSGPAEYVSLFSQVRVCAGIFTDDVSYLVALATPDEVMLLVVAFDANNQLQLWESPYYLPSGKPGLSCRHSGFKFAKRFKLLPLSSAPINIPNAQMASWG